MSVLHAYVHCSNLQAMTPSLLGVAILGAGIGGIQIAHHLQNAEIPISYCIFEERSENWWYLISFFAFQVSAPIFRSSAIHFLLPLDW